MQYRDTGAALMGKRLQICPRCQWTKEMLDQEKMKLQEYIDHIPEEAKVASGEYEKRLMLCDSCGELVDGMCRQCGCYVAVRAARRIGYCPHIHRKW
jgi:hypothetical protein